jgi:hypothetical protein
LSVRPCSMIQTHPSIFRIQFRWQRMASFSRFGLYSQYLLRIESWEPQMNIPLLAPGMVYYDRIMTSIILNLFNAFNA